MAGSKIMKDLVSMDALRMVELVLAHFELLCVVMWLCGVTVTSKGMSESEWFVYDKDTTTQNTEDTALWYCGVVGGLTFALGMLFRLFPVLDLSSGYLKISGMILILTTTLYLLFKKPNKDIMEKPLFLVNLGGVSVLLITTIFTMRYY